MSQSGEINVVENHPEIPTMFVTDSGTAIPLVNTLDIVTSVENAGTTPIETTGATNVVTIHIQKSQAIASADATKIGLCNFNSSVFSVDSTGFVTDSGTGIVKTLTGNSGGAISPTTGNINTLGTGSVTIDGSGSTLTTQLTGLTNHNVLIGAGTATITNLAPSATSGVPLISQGSSSDPIYGTVAIAGGGTNATSMSTSTGIVKYDGTSLVTSSSAKIDASNRITNSSQPCFVASKSSASTNVTGDNTLYTVVFNNVVFDNTTMYDSGTGTITFPIAGNYFVSAFISYGNISAGHTGGNVQAIATGGTYYLTQGNPSGYAYGGTFMLWGGTFVYHASASDTMLIKTAVSGSTKTVSVDGGTYITYISVYLLPC